MLPPWDRIYKTEHDNQPVNKRQTNNEQRALWEIQSFPENVWLSSGLIAHFAGKTMAWEWVLRYIDNIGDNCSHHMKEHFENGNLTNIEAVQLNRNWTTGLWLKLWKLVTVWCGEIHLYAIVLILNSCYLTSFSSKHALNSLKLQMLRSPFVWEIILLDLIDFLLSFDSFPGPYSFPKWASH